MHPRRLYAHRGASAERPENTMLAFERAMEVGVDAIETDVHLTRDGHLIVSHDETAARMTGSRLTWADITLEDARRLDAGWGFIAKRAANTRFDGQFEIPAFEEVLDLVARARGTVGVYPETKHPAYFESIGLPLEEPLVKALDRRGLRAKDAPAFVQSFEAGSLRKLRKMTGLRLVQLLEDRAAYDLAAIASYADAVGPNKNLVIPRRPDGTLGAPSGFVREAHRHGLAVHAWTFRAENSFLPKELRVGDEPARAGDLEGELARFLAAGLDGFFTDQPDIGVRAARASGR